MNTYELIKELAQEQHLSVAELERTLDLSNGSISKWTNAKPNSRYIEKIADYFHVSTDYLLGRTTVRSMPLSGNHSSHHAPEKLDLKKAADDPDTIMSWNGRPIPPEEFEMIRRILDGGK